MRLQVVLATVVLFLACIDAVSAVSGMEKAKLMPVPAVNTRLLTADKNEGADKRFLRAKTTTEYDGTGEERAVSVGNTLEKAKFYYWKTMGKQPGDIYQKYFKNKALADILGSSKHNMWKRYEVWFDKAKDAKIIKNQQDALAAARPIIH